MFGYKSVLFTLNRISQFEKRIIKNKRIGYTAHTIKPICMKLLPKKIQAIKRMEIIAPIHFKICAIIYVFRRSLLFSSSESSSWDSANSLINCATCSTYKLWVWESSHSFSDCKFWKYIETVNDFIFSIPPIKVLYEIEITFWVIRNDWSEEIGIFFTFPKP